MPRDQQTRLYERIIMDITARVESGALREGDRVDSEKELMERYEVSRITVTHAMQVLTAKGYVVRRQGKGSFVSARGTRGASSDTKRVGLLIPGTSDGHSMRIAEGFFSSLSYPQYETALFRNDTQAYESYLIRKACERGMDALCIFPADTEVYSDDILALHMRHYPFVLIDRRFPGIQTHFVISDNRLGMGLAFDHLYAMGHRDIAFCAMAGEQEQATAARLSVFADKLSARGLKPQAHQLLIDLHDQPGNKALLQDAIKHRALTAVIASNAGTLSLVRSVCAAQGARVPDDVSVVCFDCPECLDEYGFFTYIDQHSRLMAERAAGILTRALRAGMTVREPEQVVLAPELVTLKSVRGL